MRVAECSLEIIIHRKQFLCDIPSFTEQLIRSLNLKAIQLISPNVRVALLCAVLIRRLSKLATVLLPLPRCRFLHPVLHALSPECVLKVDELKLTVLLSFVYSNRYSDKYGTFFKYTGKRCHTCAPVPQQYNDLWFVMIKK